jgi:hypothetical protein
VAPLDWGLGHATRCIPILREFVAQGAEPWIAASGIQKELLQTDFSSLSFLELDGYGVNYSSQGRSLPWKILAQAPSLWNRMRKEHNWLHKVNKIHRFHGIISDNRFGLYHPEIKSVFLTHQLAIKTGLGSWANNWVNRQNRQIIERFNECWVPDWPGEENLAGELSHPATPPKQVKYIGPLSRLEMVETPEKLGLLIILSGPEPQRSILESKILEQLSQADEKFVLVRGLSAEENPIHHPKGIILNHLGSEELAKKIASAEFVICRSGYSSIMDLVKLGKPMILVPTPGQAEQEYLFNQMLTKGMAIGASQDTFNIIELLHKARSFSFQTRLYQNDLLRDVVGKWLNG